MKEYNRFDRAEILFNMDPSARGHFMAYDMARDWDPLRSLRAAMFVHFLPHLFAMEYTEKYGERLLIRDNNVSRNRITKTG